MENQHKKIKGYRDLDKTNIDRINRIKQLGNEYKEYLDELESKGIMDPHDLELAKDHIQIGVMYSVRALAQPEGFC